MRRLGRTAGGVSARFREFEDRIRKAGAAGPWPGCVLLIGLGLSAPTIAQTTLVYICTDDLGSVVAESDASDNVIKHYHYDPGEVLVGGHVTDGPGYTGDVGDNHSGRRPPPHGLKDQRRTGPRDLVPDLFLNNLTLWRSHWKVDA